MHAARRGGRRTTESRRPDVEELLRQERERSAQLEAYATDLGRTYAELRRNLHRLTVLHEVSINLAAALERSEVVSVLLSSLDNLIAFKTAEMYLLDTELDRDEDQPVESPSRPVVSLTTPRLYARRTQDDEVERAEESIDHLVPSSVVDAMASRETRLSTVADGAVEMALPLRAGAHVLGALRLQLLHAPSEEERKVLDLLATGLSVALQNAYLHEKTQRLATTDSLTGLANRFQFHEALEMETERARRMRYPVGLVMIDVDHFKQVNDSFGHPAGDEVLRQVAAVLRSRVRRTDLVGRVGGEEFALLLPGTTLDETVHVADKVREAVEEELPRAGLGRTSTPFKLTVSAGAASLGPDKVQPEMLVRLADKALYQAKWNGRNRVEVEDGSDAESEGEGLRIEETGASFSSNGGTLHSSVE